MRTSELWANVKRRLNYADKVARERGDEKFIRSNQDRAAEVQMYLTLRAYRRTHGEPELRDTVKEQLLMDDWHDLTLSEIAYVLDADINSIKSAIAQIKKDFGIEIQYVKYPKGGHPKKPLETEERNDSHD